MYVIEESLRFGAVSDSDLQKLEADLGAELPSDYRAFLKKHNGGVPKPESVSFIEHGFA